MSLSSLFNHAAAKDLSTQVSENYARQLANIVHAIKNPPPGIHRFEMTCTPLDTCNNTVRIAECEDALLAAKQALRDSAAYGELDDICKHPVNNCHLSYNSVYNYERRCVIAYAVIDTAKPYQGSDPSTAVKTIKDNNEATRPVSMPAHLTTPKVNFKARGKE